MMAAHAQLDIKEGDWSVFLHHLNQTFEALAIDTATRADLRIAVDGLKASIVTDKS